mmetsp:Transcript_5452/g.15585  ORF Transcript_5452/g.15585 Transcript_5452/m.15585 type:complete len:200 (-) Transcript_5452:109-708(-)
MQEAGTQNFHPVAKVAGPSFRILETILSACPVNVRFHANEALNTAGPNATWFKATLEAKLRTEAPGNWRANQPYHTCCAGPYRKSPNVAMRAVRCRSMVLPGSPFLLAASDDQVCANKSPISERPPLVIPAFKNGFPAATGAVPPAAADDAHVRTRARALDRSLKPPVPMLWASDRPNMASAPGTSVTGNVGLTPPHPV